MDKTITVNDAFQRGYVYELTAGEGEDFDPDFTPELTPKEMLELGVFGGLYMTDGAREFPADWFERAQLSTTGKPDKNLNHFGVIASQPLEEWQRKGWINEDDPRGWFQWYCRYYRGRRHYDDARQIKRWRAFARHAAQVRKFCEPGDPFCRPRQRQALLQWAYDSRVM